MRTPVLVLPMLLALAGSPASGLGSTRDVPEIHFFVGSRFQDNFNHGPTPDVLGVGNADIIYDLHRDGPPDMPDLLGDSLHVQGAIPTASTKYLTRLWFRVRREGPGQMHIARYRTWKARVSDGIDLVGETGPDKGRNFAFGWMDSCEVGTRVRPEWYCSQFLEMDDDFYAGGPSNDQSEENEIIWDNMLTPGSQIEYFCTANYICSPEDNFYLPDTTGQNYCEFEILPGFRSTDDGLYRMPCVLLVDASSARTKFCLAKALNVVLNGAGPSDPVPNPTSWDRYDYLEAASSWVAPMFRNEGGNSGGALAHFLGYRLILVDTSSADTPMRERDWHGFADWLTTTECSQGEQARRGLLVSGTDVAWVTSTGSYPWGWPEFLPEVLGATFLCNRYRSAGCPPTETGNDTLYCVKLLPTSGCGWTPSMPLEVLGNGYPEYYSYDVLGVSGGCGSKAFQRKSDDYVAPDAYAQVINDQSGGPYNYRTVLSTYSLGYVIRPDLAQGIPGECVADTVRIIEAAADELRNMVDWTLGISDPTSLQELCVDPCLNVTGPTSGATQAVNPGINRLYQNKPNPFNPRTIVRFSLAAAGHARLVIFDVNGREVKTLVDGRQEAGMHEAIWDGTDGQGRPVPGGVYWSQLKASGYASSRKMVVLE